MQVGIYSTDGAATCFLFDLVAAAPSERPRVVEQLAAILRAPATVKVPCDASETHMPPLRAGAGAPTVFALSCATLLKPLQYPFRTI